MPCYVENQLNHLGTCLCLKKRITSEKRERESEQLKLNGILAIFDKYSSQLV